MPHHARAFLATVKILSKAHIVKEKKEKYVMKERDALTLLRDSPFIINLAYTFQDKQNLCKSVQPLPVVEATSSSLEAHRVLTFFSAEAPHHMRPPRQKIAAVWCAPVQTEPT